MFTPFRRHVFPLASSVISIWIGMNCLARAAGDGIGTRGDRRAVGFSRPVVLCQLPTKRNKRAFADGTLRQPYAIGGRLLLLRPDGTTDVLTRNFDSAADPCVSFDAKRLLFAGKRSRSDVWNVFEMTLATHAVRQITHDQGNCRGPCYQSTLYTIVSTEPWYQITYVSDASQTQNEAISSPATALYSCKLDGSAVRQLTFNLSSDFDPTLMEDGRILFSSWQRSTLRYGNQGRVRLFGVNLDGTDFAAFADTSGKRVQHMPCVTSGGLVVFVETDNTRWDGAGSLGSVTLRRPLHSYRSLTTKDDGLFAFPSGLPDGRILVSRRSTTVSSTHDVVCFDPRTNAIETVFTEPGFHNIQAKLVYARDEPDGRSSVVTEKDATGKLYCLDVYTSDVANSDWWPKGIAKRLRVLEGLPRQVSVHAADGHAAASAASTGDASACADNAMTTWQKSLPPLAGRRFLGEIPIANDGSFNIQIPANTPVELQLLDENGLALRSCSWIWAKNHEPRGCIGCHEDGELTPENLFVDAVSRSSISLCLPESRRRSVEFRRDIIPIVMAKCVVCHGHGGDPPELTISASQPDSLESDSAARRLYHQLMTPATQNVDPVAVGRFVHPGRARTSPLIWHVFGRNTSRPWDVTWKNRPVKRIPSGSSPALTEMEQRTFVEWIDLGARFTNE